MKKISIIVLLVFFTIFSNSFSYADYMDYYKNQTQVGETGDDGEKVLSRETEGEFVKTLFERKEEDGSISHPYNAIYLWELEEYDKLTKNNSWVVKGANSKYDKENKRSIIKEYKDLNNKWVPIEDEIIVRGNMDIAKLLAHYYVIKKKYPERISEIPQDKLNNRSLKFTDDCQPKYVKESLAAIENEREKFYIEQSERNEKALKGTYVETIKSYQRSLVEHKEYLEDAKKSGDAALIKMYEDNIQDALNKIEIYSLMQQYIIEEDPNTNQELLRKWNLTKLTSDDRYLYYNKPEPLKIADGFEIYEDKTEFNCYYDDIVVDANGKRNRVYCRHKTDKNVKTNLDPNRFVVENVENLGVFSYRIYDKNPIYTMTYIRDDNNMKIHNSDNPSTHYEADYQVYEFKYDCVIGIPLNGRISFNVTFDSTHIGKYWLQKFAVPNGPYKDYYIKPDMVGIQISGNIPYNKDKYYKKGETTFTISNQTRYKNLASGIEKFYEKYSQENVKIKEICYAISSDYHNFHGVLDSN